VFMTSALFLPLVMERYQAEPMEARLGAAVVCRFAGSPGRPGDQAAPTAVHRGVEAVFQSVETWFDLML
jgi:hypothetical protein